MCALFFQHILGLHPCVMCIYERIATLGVLTAGLIGMVNPQKWYLRWSALLLWAFSAFRGLQLALQHVDYQINSLPLQCLQPLCRLPKLAAPGHLGSLALLPRWGLQRDQLAVPRLLHAPMAGRHLRRLPAGGNRGDDWQSGQGPLLQLNSPLFMKRGARGRLFLFALCLLSEWFGSCRGWANLP
ncbi:disulfide bond formation protein B [Aeromonas molluscorum 848]|uniref:Disulfide bond formation protein B n=1 Tax=Aeromonas molluscorum 848 TaxID=1268236 RepID=R1H8H7_9GAMM|nr:disulfide bond formation protein B [Aeromonas molluscorum 848]